MGNEFHKNLVDADIHALPAATYADIAARDADTAFHVAENVNKLVRVDSPISFFALTSTAPTWAGVASGTGPTFADVLASGNTSDGTALIVSAGDDMVVGGAAPAAVGSSIDLKATNRALFLNRLTTVQRDALTPLASMTIFNTDTSQVESYNGTSWMSLGAGGGDVLGPGSAINEALARFDGTTGKVLQNSLVGVDDLGNMVVTGFAIIDGQVASRIGTTIFEIFSMADFPAPVAGVITLTSGHYFIKNDLSTSDRFEIGTAARVTFSIDDSRNNTFTYTGTDTLFSATTAELFVIELVRISCTGVGAQLFDIDSGSLSIVDARIDLTGSGSTIGSISSAFLAAFRSVEFTSYTNGMVITDVDVISFDHVLLAGSGGGTDALISILSSVGSIATIATIVASPGVNESLFFIDPTIDKTVSIAHTINLGAGEFFKPSVTNGRIIAMADQGSTIQLTSNGHGLSNGDTVNITGTVNYDAGYVVSNVATNTFEVVANFVIAETGDWNTASLDHKNKFVTSLGNGNQADSSNRGTVLLRENTAVTVISTINTFVDLNLGALAFETSGIELWKLIDTTTGELRYDGLKSVSLDLTGLVAGISSGASQRFNFRLLRNGSPLPMLTNVNIPLEIGSDVSSSPLHWEVDADPGDTFRLQVENANGTSNITIDTLKVTIS